jgi:hypothetical protein
MTLSPAQLEELHAASTPKVTREKRGATGSPLRCVVAPGTLLSISLR